jgi:hypothetical protein
MMAAFAGYGFPKAHAASMPRWPGARPGAKPTTRRVYRAVLANWGGYYPQSVYLNEARRLGLRAAPAARQPRPPAVQRSYPTASRCWVHGPRPGPRPDPPGAPRNRRVRELLTSSRVPLLVEGTVERDPATGEPVLHANNLWKIE